MFQNGVLPVYSWVRKVAIASSLHAYDSNKQELEVAY